MITKLITQFILYICVYLVQGNLLKVNIAGVSLTPVAVEWVTDRVLHKNVWFRLLQAGDAVLDCDVTLKKVSLSPLSPSTDLSHCSLIPNFSLHVILSFSLLTLLPASLFSCLYFLYSLSVLFLSLYTQAHSILDLSLPFCLLSLFSTFLLSSCLFSLSDSSSTCVSIFCLLSLTK